MRPIGPAVVVMASGGTGMTLHRAPRAFAALLFGISTILPGAPLHAQPPLNELRVLAERGDAEAQSGLGYRYLVGRGVPHDDAEAVWWLRQAADQGFAPAQFNLGLIYDNGQGVPQNDVEAVRWYRLAAAQGMELARFNLGIMYDSGLGVPQDGAEAVRWYRLAAEQGYAQAQNNLGVMYTEGRGVPPDDAAAVQWYRLAADQGHAAAQETLGFMYCRGPGYRARLRRGRSLVPPRGRPGAHKSAVQPRGDVHVRLGCPARRRESPHVAQPWGCAALRR